MSAECTGLRITAGVIQGVGSCVECCGPKQSENRKLPLWHMEPSVTLTRALQCSWKDKY